MFRPAAFLLVAAVWTSVNMSVIKSLTTLYYRKIDFKYLFKRSLFSFGTCYSINCKKMQKIWLFYMK